MRFRFVGIVSVLALGSLVGCSSDTTAPPGVDPDTGAADTGTARDSAAPTDTGSDDTGSDEDTGSIIDSTVADSGAADTADTLPVDTSLPDTADTAVLDAADTAVIDAADTAVIDAADTDVVDAIDSAMDDAMSDATDGADAGPVLPTAEVWVTRVGDGSAALSNASTAVFVEKFQLATKTLLGTINMPIAVSGSNQPLTFSGTATSEGVLSRSGDGKYVSLGGYGVAPGTASVANTATTAVPRVIARVNAAGVVDTTTTTTSHSANNIRGAVTFDGSAFWSFGGVDGIQYITHGTTAMAGTLVSTGIANVRYAALFEDGTLWGTTSSGSTYRIFNFGTTARPTTGTTPVAPTGLPITGGSPYGIAGIAAVGTAVDTIYQCEDTTTTGGVLRYKLTAGTWGAAVRLTEGITSGCRGLAVMKSGTTVIIVAVTGENPSRVIVVLDTTVGITAPGTVTTLATATTNTQYRGPAFAPVP